MYRCTLEQRTYWVGFPTALETVFKTEAFRFLPSGNTIHVECVVRMCLMYDADPNCDSCLTPGPPIRMLRGLSAGQLESTGFRDSKPTVIVKSSMFYIIEKGLELFL